MVGTLVDEFVLRLIVTERVVEQLLIVVGLLQSRALFGGIIAAVEKSFTVLRPGSAGKLDPLDQIRQIFPVSTSRTRNSTQSDPAAAIP
jgi:hypothetical protein